MIWYLLYPIRGTSQPPLLPSEHPIRRAFYRHGATTARNWLLAMLATVAIGVIFTYPVIFMPDFPNTGISGLPHHVWTGSSSVETKSEKKPDLEMRQIWMHGSYMQALSKSTLSQALELQHAILADESSVGRGYADYPASTDWGYHSPLMYWNNTMSILEADSNILNTVNDYSHSTSFLNFTLRPMSVFAGKHFTGSRLAAADALLLTLCNRNNDSIGERWQQRLDEIASNPPGSWTVDTRDTNVETSRIYEYRFQPLSFRQNSALAIAYGLMVVYVAASLRRLKAFRSRFGLVVTALTQMTTSVLASFTICGLLKINLAQIPQEAYPFVVLTIGLENIFRLINAVLAYPPEIEPQQRIANGLGDIGHSSLVSAAQNLLILWLLSLVVSPGVSAFCAFAAVALLFDYFFLMTFFVAVLNVDMRRLELQDSITRSRHTKDEKKRPTPQSSWMKPDKEDKKPKERPSWIDALIHGRVPFSTRMAGSAVTITFVLALNWHFSDHSLAALRQKSWSLLSSKWQEIPTTEFDGTAPPPMNQTRDPATWLQLQDFDNAAQFVNIVKPGAHSFTTRVFDPIVLVLSDANRTGIPLADKNGFLFAVRDLATHHFYPFFLAVVFVVAFVTVLMNFLLWDGRAEAAEKEKSSQVNDSPLTVESIEPGHKLDIVKIAASDYDQILTAGYDRSLCLSWKDRLSQIYSKAQIGLTDEVPASGLTLDWPIDDLFCDTRGDSFAVHCTSGKLLLGHGDQFICCLDINTQMTQQDLVLSCCVSKTHDTSEEDCLVFLADDGTLVEYRNSFDKPLRQKLDFGDAAIVSASMLDSNIGKPAFVGLLSSGTLFGCRWSPSRRCWTLRIGENGDIGLDPANEPADEACIHSSSELDMILVCASNQISIVEASTLKVQRKLDSPNARPKSVRVLHTPSERCPDCSGTAVSSLTLAYNETHTGHCVLVSFEAEITPPKPFCVAANTPACQSVSHAKTSCQRLESPGVWECTSQQAIAGVRRPPLDKPIVEDPETSSDQPLLRRRRPIHDRRNSPSDSLEEPDDWEAYIFTTSGQLHTSRLNTSSDSGTQLYASEPGPICRFGANAVAVALGNMVHVVRVGLGRDNGSLELQLKRSGSSASNSKPARRKPRKSG